MASNNGVGIPGLDRKAMEAERLARQAARQIKRERSISPPARSSRKAPKLEETTTTLASGARLKTFSSMVQEGQQSRKPAAANAAIKHMKTQASSLEPAPSLAQPFVNHKRDSLPQATLKYPRGVVKKTWAFGHERTGNDVKIEEVLEPLTCRTAVLSAFQWDVDWVFSKLKTPLNGGSTKCIFVMQAKGEEERARMRDVAKERAMFLRLCLPPMDGLIWCMHSKLMLLFHPNKLRIAIPTANLLNFDWGETGMMENSVFMIDLPRLPIPAKAGELPPFGQELLFFTEKQGLDQDIRDGILSFDFSATKDMAFIHTVGGVHYRNVADRTGLFGLSQAVRKLNLSSANLEIDFAASSIGQLNEKYLRDLHAAAQGTDLIHLAATGKSNATANFFKPKPASSTPTQMDIKSHIRIYFPTHATVTASTAGAAGTICLQRSYFESKTFPKACFRDYTSTREGLLSHNKILCARGKDVAWVYVGSANMSKSAWGELPADRKERKITCRNWECGVLLPVVRKRAVGASAAAGEGEDSETESEDGSEDGGTGEDAVVGFDVFKDVIELPFKVPGDEYGGREPWYFKE